MMGTSTIPGTAKRELEPIQLSQAATLTTLIDRLDSSAVLGTDVIRWGCPVLAFGDLSRSQVATVGLNPSSREFMDELGSELQGKYRRFHTLGSLGLRSWSDVDARHLRLILESCRSYFYRNPYDRWFKTLDRVVSGTKASFYDISSGACHLDLSPYATASKWTDLSARQRSSLLEIGADALGLLLRDSPVRVLILNGRSVVEQFQDVADIRMSREQMPAWSLPRKPMSDVKGVGYRGVVKSLAGIRLSHEILVLGYNHNLQSSFGVTRNVVQSIRGWIAQVTSTIDQ